MESSTPAFAQSLAIIVREGLEVVLIIGAMLAVVARAGAPEQARGLWWGSALAVVASILTAAAVEALFRSAQQVEFLEGVTMLTAAVVLVLVGHWLLARADVERWRAYVKRRVGAATRRGSLLALGGVAFVAVYREGVETVLFYRALLSAEAARGGAILSGLLLGVGLLALLCWGIVRFGVRVPLRPFFAGTSALLLLLAFAFAGKGLHELQEAGAVGETGVAFLRIPPLGVYPTLETLAGQGIVLLAIVLPVLRDRVRERARDRRESMALGPASEPPAEGRPAEPVAGAAG